MMEYNANFEVGRKTFIIAGEKIPQVEEAKSIMPPGENEDWRTWDGSTYHGWSILAVNSILFLKLNFCSDNL